MQVITSGCATFPPWASALGGIVGGLITLPGSLFVLHILKVDDPVDAFVVSLQLVCLSMYLLCLSVCRASLSLCTFSPVGLPAWVCCLLPAAAQHPPVVKTCPGAWTAERL